jgi:ribonuclease HI
VLAERGLPVSPFALIVPRLPRTVKNVVYFLATGPVWMERKRYRVGVRGRSLAWPSHHIPLWRCIVFEHGFLAVCDGGSQGDGAANRGYGSYQLATRDGRKQTVRLDLGTATNNETEYRTLIAALKDLLGRIQKAGRSPASYSLLAYTDSQLMVGQITQGWQVKAANLRPLINEAKAPLKAFGRADLVKVPRDEIVRVLGHWATLRELDPLAGIGLSFSDAQVHQ